MARMPVSDVWDYLLTICATINYLSRSCSLRQQTYCNCSQLIEVTPENYNPLLCQDAIRAIKPDLVALGTYSEQFLIN